ncbi:hypothetical protein GCM10007919_66820 [Rhizobium indigoferae]|nr:hypothetical protein GCM10007919_66820 [Rhizobium indigoferae]
MSKQKLAWRFGREAAGNPAIVNQRAGFAATEIAALLLPIGRPSIAPEKLLRAMLLQAFYGSEKELFPRHARVKRIVNVRREPA